jgi:hypothetical protein
MSYRWFSLLLFSTLIVFSTKLSGQKNNEVKSFVTTLKEGALLIRMESRDDALRILREKERNEEAAELERKQYLEIKETRLSFEQTFTFCPVYFFYAKDSELIREGRLNGLIFNAQEEPVKVANMPKQYYTAEFSETPKLGITGLIIMDEKLLPLEGPLPHFERKFVWFGLRELSKAQMAEAYNERLWSLYNKYQTKN